MKTGRSSLQLRWSVSGCLAPSACSRPNPTPRTRKHAVLSEVQGLRIGFTLSFEVSAMAPLRLFKSVSVPFTFALYEVLVNRFRSSFKQVPKVFLFSVLYWFLQFQGSVRVPSLKALVASFTPQGPQYLHGPWGILARTIVCCSFDFLLFLNFTP